MILSWLLAPGPGLLRGATLLRTLSLGYIRQRGTRTGLIVASVALGVATLVATRALNQNLSEATKSAVNPLAGVAHLLVTNGQTGVPRAAVQKLEQARADGRLRGDVQPVVLGRVAVPELDNRSVLLLGVKPPDSEILQAYRNKDVIELKSLGITIRKTATDLEIAAILFSGREQVYLSRELERELRERRGRFRVRVSGREKQAQCVGTVEVVKEAGAIEKHVVFMLLDPAAQLIFPGRQEFVTQVNIVLDDPATAGRLRGSLQEIVGPPYNVQTVEENYESVKDLTAGLELGFSLLGAAALIVGLFLVYNALSVSVAERRHDIGILRSVGATRGQIARLFVGEAALLGLIGSLLGLPLGYLLARVALGPMSRMVSEVLAPIETPSVHISAWTVAFALGSGVATTILAALVPALQASMEEPADAVRRVPVVPHFLYRVALTAATAALFAAALACVLLRAYLPSRWGTFVGAVFLLLGALVATPLLALFLGRLIQPFFRRLFGLEGRLAADNLVRSPGRTGIVIAVLAASGALLVSTSGYIRSTEDAVLSWLDESIAADLFVTSGSSMRDRPSEMLPMDESLAHELAALPGVEAVLPVRWHFLEFRERLILLGALDADAFSAAPGTHALARNLERFPRLREPGTALVSDNFAALYGVKVGDRVTIAGPEYPLEVEVIGTIVDYTWNRGAIMVNRAWYREHYRDSLINFFDLYLAKDADREAVMRTIEQKWGRTDAVHVVSRSTLRDAVASTLRKVYGLAYAQQVVVGLVALLGVVSALFISVLQRRRELGLLRAVGASRAQVLRSVLAEAFLMGLIGAPLGFGMGLLIEWYTLEIMLMDDAGFVFPMRVAWLAAGAVTGSSVLLASLVGLGPAWEATRIRIAEAIAYE